MFAAPPEQSLEWSDTAVEGSHRFLKRLWKAVYNHVSLNKLDIKLNIVSLNDSQKALRRKTHQTIRKVSDDVSRRLTFNTAIAAIMELMNDVAKFKDTSEQGIAVMQETLEAVTLMLAPIAPHICHKLWRDLGHEDAVIHANWPSFDESALTVSSQEIVIQVNGKVRAKVEVSADMSKEDMEKVALKNENVQRFLNELTIRKVIVVPGKLVSIVAN
jgi:leucyl-tRNA synthetase